MSAIGTVRLLRPDPRTLGRREEHHRGIFSACHLADATVLVTATGEIDATNGRILADYVERQLAGSTHLVLDLTVIDFFGTAGFAALHNINVMCARYGITWVLMLGPQLQRFRRICDPENLLPVQGSALDHLNTGPRDRQFLVGGNH